MGTRSMIEPVTFRVAPLLTRMLPPWSEAKPKVLTEVEDVENLESMLTRTRISPLRE